MGFIREVVKFFAMRTVEAFFVVTLILIMPSVPPFGEYTSFTVTPSLPLEGALALNNKLENAEHLFSNEVHGPEAFAHYNGELYTSTADGYVKKVENGKLIPIVKFGNDKCKNEFYQESDCGRPLGLNFDKNGQLFVIESYSGIWKVNLKTGEKTLLISRDTEIEGRKPKLPNSVAVASNGDLYWSDSSSEYDLQNGVYVLLADGTGRLFHYDAVKKTNKVLIDKLHFANGVHLSDNEDFVIVSDLTKSRILRYYLKGSKKGQQDVFLDGLPGLPDNICSDGQGGFLFPIVFPRDTDYPSIIQVVTPFSWIRKFVARVVGLMDFAFEQMNAIYPNYYAKVISYYVANMGPMSILAPKRVSIIRVNNEGTIIDSYHSLNGAISGISEAHIFGDHLYLGSPFNRYIGRVKLSDLNLKPTKDHVKREIKDQEAVKPKPTTTTPKPTTTTTTPKPTTTTPKPTTTTPKPTTTTPKPTTTTPKPVKTTPKPTTTTPKPTTTTPKPTTTTPKPTTTTPKPTTTTPKPTTTKPKPATNSKPVKEQEKPAEKINKEEIENNKPTNTQQAKNNGPVKKEPVKKTP